MEKEEIDREKELKEFSKRYPHIYTDILALTMCVAEIEKKIPNTQDLDQKGKQAIEMAEIGHKEEMQKCLRDAREILKKDYLENISTKPSVNIKVSQETAMLVAIALFEKRASHINEIRNYYCRN